MEQVQNFLLNLSVLHRNTAKFLDKQLSKYDIGSGQVIFLLYIYEHEGITLADVTKVAEVDKGTTTKSVQKLLDQGYVVQEVDQNDKRVRRLYTTSKTADIIDDIYEIRNEIRHKITKNIDVNVFESLLKNATENSRERDIEEEGIEKVKIGGISKMTLVDYPGKLACTIMMGGCGFKCPYCQNRDLVFLPENFHFLDEDEVCEYLEKRVGMLEGVCISGGEPLRQSGLERFLKRVKDLGYSIKLDTNGYQIEELKRILQTGYVDFVAMDIKNSIEKYGVTAGMNKDNFSKERIEEAVQMIQESSIPHEFRTTVVKELHELEDLKKVAMWLGNEETWVLQQFNCGMNTIQDGLSSYTMQELEEMKSILQGYVKHIEVRGIK